MKLLILWILSLIISVQAFAHRNMDGNLSLSLEKDQIFGEWRIPLRDLEATIGLDTDLDGKITWLELSQRKIPLQNYLQNKLQFQTKQNTCLPTFTDQLVQKYDDEHHFAVLRFKVNCFEQLDSTETLIIHYQFLFEIDAQHKCVLSVKYSGNQYQRFFSTDNRSRQVDLKSRDVPHQIQNWLGDWLKYLRNLII